MGLWKALNGGNSKWDADSKTDKTQHRRDILGFKTSSRPNHESQRDKELWKKEVKKAKKAEKKGFWS